MKHIQLFEKFDAPKNFWKPTKISYWEGNKISKIDALKASACFDDSKKELDKFIKKFSLSKREDFNGELVFSKTFDADNELTVYRDGDCLILTVIGKNAKKQVDDFLKK